MGRGLFIPNKFDQRAAEHHFSGFFLCVLVAWIVRRACSAAATQESWPNHPGELRFQPD
jgi:hypothetical protein